MQQLHQYTFADTEPISWDRVRSDTRSEFVAQIGAYLQHDDVVMLRAIRFRIESL